MPRAAPAVANALATRVGSSLFFACLMFGAGIWRVAQVFQINAHWPDGIWWWALGTLPVALCLDTLVVHCLLVGLLAVWAGSELIGFPHLGAVLGPFSERGLHPVADGRPRPRYGPIARA